MSSAIACNKNIPNKKKKHFFFRRKDPRQKEKLASQFRNGQRNNIFIHLKQMGENVILEEKADAHNIQHNQKRRPGFFPFFFYPY
jgi:hypothetical protein